MTASVLPRGHLSSEALDLLLLASLESAQKEEAQRHLEHCAQCQAHWRELLEAQQHFQQYVLPRTLPQVEARIERGTAKLWGRWKSLWVTAALGLAAALTLVATHGPSTEDDDYFGIKGSPTLEIVASRKGGDSFPVSSGVTLSPKDRIRFVVNPAGAKYVMIASRDGAGVFSVYYPFGAHRSEALIDTKGKAELPGAIELDATLGSEQVVAVFSKSPIEAKQVEAALVAAPENPQLPGARCVTTKFVKVEK